MGPQFIPAQRVQDPSLARILITDQLEQRPPRAPNLGEENRALHSLAQLLAGSPQNLLDNLVAIACELCQAGSTGVSVLTILPNGEQVFSWVAMAGAWKSYIGGSTPAEFSPCGTCLALGAPQLYASPARYYTYLDAADPPLLEGLVIPLSTAEGPIGTIWIADHFGKRMFDAEDVRILTSLAGFTGDGLRTMEFAAAESRARAEAEQALRIRDEFLISIAHDLKGPLTTIKGMAQLMRRQLTSANSGGSERLNAGLAKIDVGATKMAAQIDELLDVARLQSGEQLDLRYKSTDVVTLARQIVAEQQRLTQRHIQFDSDNPEMLGSVDEVRFGRVIANVLNNAVKYSPYGGNIEVTISSLAEGNLVWALLTVRDEGIGIPEADLPYVFQRFRRGSNVGETITGSGIGLTTARLIVEQHGGNITVESTEGVGSTFTIRLPLAKTSVCD